MGDRTQLARRSRRKGKAYQKRIARAIVSYFTELGEDDIVSCPGGKKEPDLRLSEAAQRLYPFHVECKNCKVLRLSEWLSQAVEDSMETGRTPTVVFTTHGSSRDWVVLPLHTWLYYYREAVRSIHE